MHQTTQPVPLQTAQSFKLARTAPSSEGAVRTANVASANILPSLPAAPIPPESHADLAMLESQGTLREVQVKQGNAGMTLTVTIEVGRRQFSATVDTAAQVTIMTNALAEELGISVLDAEVVSLSGAKQGNNIEARLAKDVPFSLGGTAYLWDKAVIGATQNNTIEEVVPFSLGGTAYLWDFDIPHAIIDPSKKSENTCRPSGETGDPRPTVLIRKIDGVVRGCVVIRFIGRPARQTQCCAGG
jgi:hypothetical protein